MSSNVELVRSIYAEWERGNHGSVEWADPAIEFVIADGPSPGSSKGLAAMAGAWRDFTGGFEDLLTFAEGYRELDDERVLVLTRYRARGKESGLDVETLGVMVFDVHERKVKRLVRYWDPQRAADDLGLPPEEPFG